MPRTRLGLTTGCLVAAVLVAPAAARAVPGSLIAGKGPSSSRGVSHAGRLTDGVAPPEGDFWKTDRTARLLGADAHATWDLGTETPLDSVWLIGDHNDAYELSLSHDGSSFEPLWKAPPVGGGGLRERHVSGLGKTARFVRVTASGGDGSYALGELQVFDRAESGPVDVARRAGAKAEQQVRDRTLVWGFFMVVLLALSRRGSSRLWLGALLAAAGFSAWRLLSSVAEAWPLDAHEVSLARGVLAVVAGAALARDALGRLRRPAHTPVVLGTLALTALLGVAAFYGFGRPQFFDVGNRKWTFAHYWDLRQYYPTAKYFKELGYRRMYLADAMAYVENNPGLSLDAIESRHLRSLDTFRETTIAAERPAIESIKERFSPERWEDYKRDADFLRRTMGTENYLDTLRDFGGNATPLWMSIAHILFNAFSPDDRVFTAMGFVDLLLLGVAFFLMRKAYGVRTMFAAMVVFGCNDFIMYGTNWAGAPLRHDWLAYLGIGASLLRLGRSYAGGAFLMFAAMIRAFPALAVAAATLPALWTVADRVRTQGRFPTRSTLRADLAPALRIAVGATVAGAVLFGFSAIVLGPSSWVEWFGKASQLNADPHPAHVTMRTFMGGWDDDQYRVLAARGPLYVTLIALYVGLALRAARRRGADEAAVLGMTLVPVLVYPANYYVHLVYLVPLLMGERRGRPIEPSGVLIGCLVLVMCAASFFTTLIPTLPLHFYAESVVYLTFLLLILLAANARTWLDARLRPL